MSTEKETYTLSGLITSLYDELEDHKEEIFEDPNDTSLLYELVDGCLPLSYHDIARYFMNNTEFDIVPSGSWHCDESADLDINSVILSAMANILYEEADSWMMNAMEEYLETDC